MEKILDNTSCHCCKEGEYLSFRNIWNSKDKDLHSKKFFIYEIKDYIPNLNEAIEDSYMCLNANCKHVYRHFKKDIAAFHRDDYRKKELVENHTNTLLSMGDEQKILKRHERFKTALHIVKSYIKPEHDVLEVASGRGYFLGLAKNYFKSITGMDIDPKTKIHNSQINPEVNYIVSDFNEMKETKKYDCLLAFDVLEHIENLNSFVKKAYNLTDKYVLIQVPIGRPIIPPNAAAMENKPIYTDNAGQNVSLEFDGHLHYFTENSLIRLFTKDNLFECSFIYKSKPKQLASGLEILAVFKKQGD